MSKTNQNLDRTFELTEEKKETSIGTFLFGYSNNKEIQLFLFAHSF